MCGELFSLNFEVDLNDDPGSFGGATTTRKCTDILGFIIMVFIFGLTIGLMAYCMYNSEVEKLINGADYCGNICGKANIKTDSIPFACFGKNNEKKEYAYMTGEEILPAFKLRKNCYHVCPAKLVGHYCVDDKSVIPFYVKLHKLFWWVPIMVYFISICFGVGLYFLIYHCDLAETKDINSPRIVIFVIIIAAILPMIGFMRFGLLGQKDVLIVRSILATIAAIAAIIMIPSLNDNLKRVDEVYRLYKEAAAATNSINLIWILPIVSSIIFTAYVYGMTHCLLYLESFSYAEKIVEQTPEHPIIEYIPYPIATMTQALVIYTIFLLYEFMKNLQTLIISGSVAQSYFTKQDDEESEHTITPLLKHLGTVCCASVILSVTFPIRVVVNALKGIVILSYKNCLYSCSRPLTTGTLFLTRNGLIMTAIHGSSFCAGTIRARKLLHHNVFNATAICTFGDFTSLIWKLFFWFCSSFICYFSTYTTSYASFKRELVYLVCCGFLAALLLDYYASVLEIAINTIFLCFCEDCLYNNGASKPYFMSGNFAKFVENANNFVDEDKWNTVADKWYRGPRRLY